MATMPKGQYKVTPQHILTQVNLVMSVLRCMSGETESEPENVQEDALNLSDIMIAGTESLARSFIGAVNHLISPKRAYGNNSIRYESVRQPSPLEYFNSRSEPSLIVQLDNTIESHVSSDLFGDKIEVERPGQM
jgi:hypothetical protein